MRWNPWLLGRLWLRRFATRAVREQNDQLRRRVLEMQTAAEVDLAKLRVLKVENEQLYAYCARNRKEVEADTMLQARRIAEAAQLRER